MISIDRSKSDDLFYRYKMPPAQVVHETSRTVISNMEQVAKALERNPVHILKFLSMSFGCTCVTSPKYALNGNFDAERIRSGVYDFIDMFVLCRECGNPETRFVHGAVLKRSCSSCGAVVAQEDHKLNAAISKEKNAREDTRYDISNKCNIGHLVKAEGDNSQRIYEVFKQNELELEDLFSEYVRAQDLKQLQVVLRDFEAQDVLRSIEKMLEAHRKEDKMEGFLNALVAQGVPRGAIVAYAESPRAEGKRAAIVKKIFSVFSAAE